MSGPASASAPFDIGSRGGSFYYSHLRHLVGGCLNLIPADVSLPHARSLKCINWYLHIAPFIITPVDQLQPNF